MRLLLFLLASSQSFERRWLSFLGGNLRSASSRKQMEGSGACFRYTPKHLLSPPKKTKKKWRFLFFCSFLIFLHGRYQDTGWIYKKQANASRRNVNINRPQPCSQQQCHIYFEYSTADNSGSRGTTYVRTFTNVKNLSEACLTSLSYLETWAKWEDTLVRKSSSLVKEEVYSVQWPL